MEGVAAWIAGYCDEILQVHDGGETLQLEGVRVIGTDPARGFDVAFALETYHPQNVLGVEIDAEVIDEVLNSVFVERLFLVGDYEDDVPPPRGWRIAKAEIGLLLERCEDEQT